MARQKQRDPRQVVPDGVNGKTNGHSEDIKDSARSSVIPQLPETKAGTIQLAICVAGIYASFLSWAFLQERITTTQYGREKFAFPVVLNTIQSTFAAIVGFLYLLATKPLKGSTPSIFPSYAVILPLLLVSITSSLASPFGYASLSHIDYITFTLAKSCKLLPVMFLHLTVFRKSYPLHKYLIVASVTAGVAIFTLYHPQSAKKAASSRRSGSSAWGLGLLGINLLFDGLTNSTQDHIFSKNRQYKGPQMMVGQNILCTILTVLYLILSPILGGILSSLVGIGSDGNELSDALNFIARHPQALPDILAFAACGAIGQIFIYLTLSKFSSLLLVTVTVTRKMLTMVLSVLWFGHKLTSMQWIGVALVFGAIAAEGWIKKMQDGQKRKVHKKEL